MADANGPSVTRQIVEQQQRIERKLDALHALLVQHFPLGQPESPTDLIALARPQNLVPTRFPLEGLAQVRKRLSPQFELWVEVVPPAFVVYAKEKKVRRIRLGSRLHEVLAEVMLAGPNGIECSTLCSRLSIKKEYVPKLMLRLRSKLAGQSSNHSRYIESKRLRNRQEEVYFLNPDLSFCFVHKA